MRHLSTFEHRALRGIVRAAATLLVLAALAGPARADPPLAIVVGDSIAREYPIDYYGWNIEGWGYFLAQHLSQGLTWRNDAIGSQSTKSFIAEGHWANTIAAHPQYIFIQFGLGDESGVDGLATDPETDFRANLHQMITDARGVGAVPILVTPPVIRWAYAGSNDLGRPNGLEDWVTAMLEQAAADNVGFVDMQGWSGRVCDSMGLAMYQQLYGFIIPEGPWPIPGGTVDELHFSHYGADQAALMIIDRLKTIQPELVTHLTPPPVPAPVPALPGPLWKLVVCGALLGALSAAAARGSSSRRARPS
ncbi:MAG TPA: GDSL-type esterase/lipase family protein [Myxococcota bacterium]|nr:GDSL-type esterase/lipase family protein [Myxococcota bacterium]